MQTSAWLIAELITILSPAWADIDEAVILLEFST